MSTLKTNNVQVGQSVTATNNFTIYQPSTPDGTVRIGVGNSGATTADVITANSSGNVGIGTSSPASLLHIRQDQNGTTRSIIHNRNGSGTPLSELTFITGGLDLSDNRYAYIQSGGGGSSYLALGTSNGSTPTEGARLTAAGLFQFNSGYGSVATAYACRAWVNFNGTGTVAIRASANVSSITDNGTGDYTLNFTTAMPDANYVVSGSANDSAGSSSYVWLTTGAGLYGTILRSTTQVRVQSAYVSTGVADASTVNVAIFR